VRLLVALAVVGRSVRVARRDYVVLVLALLLGRNRRVVVVARLRLRLVVLIGILVEGGLVVTACGVR
jgi:hypothetical protein